MMSSTAPSLAEAVRQGVLTARIRCRDPLARVGLLCPTRTIGTQLMRDLVAGGGVLRVDVLTPGEIVAALGRPALSALGSAPEPPGWQGALLSALLPRLDLGPYAETLRQPGWRGPLLAALAEVETAGASPDLLRAVGQEHPDLYARCAILATLLEAVAQARAAERLYPPSALEQAALDHLNRALPPDGDDIQAAIVVGDTMLSPRTHAVLAAWLARRDPLRIALYPMENLPPATCGLRLAATQAQARVTAVQTPPTALGHLQRGAFAVAAAGLAAAPTDESVVLASTADEVRDVEEAVREVMRAVRQGVALDRIAIVLPDPSQVEVLEDALARAGLPAAWLTGAPLRRSPVARFLTLALRVARGEDAPLRWYQLLTQPGVAGLVQTGRLRWRRLLSEAPVGGMGTLQAHLGARRDAAPEDAPQRTALVSLVQNLELLHTALTALPRQAPLSVHARAWRTLLERFAQAGASRTRVLRLLDGWGGGAGSAGISLAAAASLLDEHLAQTPDLQGSLAQRAVRVLPPMVVLGGSYALVCLTGVTEGRLPRRVVDSGVLHEELRAALRARGVPLVTRAEREAVEQRRMASVLSGCRGRLWLSSPRAELLEGRPSLPGALLLQVASALSGTRLSPTALQQRLVPYGWRSTPAPLPEDAAHPAEYRVARAAHAPHAHLPDLLRHPTLRRLVCLQRAIDQVLYEGQPPNAWTGLVAPSLLPSPVLAGEALDAATLARLVLDPAAYFFGDLLGARTASALRGQGGLSSQDLRREVLALAAQATSPDAFAEAWAQRLEAWAQPLGLDDAARLALRVRGLRHYEILQRHGATQAAPLPPVAAAPLPGGFVLRVEGAWLQGDALLERRTSIPTGTLKADSVEGLRVLAQGFALAAAGQPVQRVRQVGLNDHHREALLERQRADFTAALEVGAVRAAVGWWPTLLEGAGRFSLARERADGKRLDPAEVFSRLPPRSPAP